MILSRRGPIGPLFSLMTRTRRDLRRGLLGLTAAVLLQAISATALTAYGLLLPSTSFAQASCGTTEICKSPRIGPWRYFVSAGGINKWFPTPGDAEAAIQALIMAPSNHYCSLTEASRQSDVYVGGAGSYPVYYLGIEVGHSTQITYNVVGSDTAGCLWTVTTYGSYQHSRDVTCDTGYSLKGGSGGVAAYCGKPIADEEKEKMQGRTCPDKSPKVGNPCDVASGNKVQTEADYRGAGVFPLSFTRTYNSVQAYADDTTTQLQWRPLGKGWSATYFQRLLPSEWGGRSTVRAYRPDGRLITFDLSGSQYIPDADIAERLTRLYDGGGNPTGWSLVTREDSTELYDVNGRLLSITTRTGLKHTLTYNGSGRLDFVADDFGRQLTFTYSADSFRHVTGFADPAGGTYQLTFDADENLETVTYPDTKVRRYHYDASSLFLGVTDEASVRFSTFTYDASKRVLTSEHAGVVDKYTIAYPGTLQRTVTDPLNTSRTYGFTTKLGFNVSTGITQPAASGSGTNSTIATVDSNGNVSSSTDRNGNVTIYSYDTARILETSRTEAYGTAKARTISTTWHSTFRLPTQITEPNRTTGFTHDSSGNVLTKTVTDTSVTPNVSRTWTYTYNSFGQVLTADGPRTDVSDVTSYSYYSAAATCSATVTGATTTGCRGQLDTITDALSHVTTFDEYNANGQPVKLTDANSVVTTLGYDSRQRLISRTVDGETTAFTYWPTGLLKKVTLPDSSYVQYTYDNAHRLNRIDDGAGNYILYTLDAMGNRTAENSYDSSSALARTHSRVINSLNKVWKEVNAGGTSAVTTVFGYDDNGNQTTINAPLSRNTTNAYDELNRLKQITDPATGVTQFSYDANDNLTGVTDPRSLGTTYQYTGFGDLKQQVSPDTGTTTHTYDSGGNLATSTDARNAVASYGYDALNRVTQVAYGDQTITYGYDSGSNGIGRLTSASDANHSLSWSYDGQGRVTDKSQTVGSVTKSVSYGYTSGNLTSLTTPSGQSVVYSYNSNHQVTSVSVNGTTVLSSVLYDPFGPVRGWSWGNATLAVRTFDSDGKITQVDSAGLKTYGYDDAFRITGVTDTVDSALSWTYGYDLLDRLTSGSKSGLNQSFTYDANGNRLTQGGTSSTTFTVSSTSNRLSSTSGALSRTYGYDAAGNTTSDGSLSFTYNNAGRMKTSVTGGVTTTYLYNALGQRVKKSGGAAGTVLYWYDEAGHLLGEYDSSGNLIQETIWLGDIPVATLRPGSPVAIYYVHTDHLNTPRKVSRPSDDALLWRWDSDPFGTTAPNENPASLGTFHYHLRFPGQYFDTESGLSYNYFRDYDAAIGRYVESDPIGLDGGTNTYGYVSNNPVAVVDPAGLYECTYSISAHRLTCTPSRIPHASFDSDDFVAGNNNAPASKPCNCQNNPAETSYPFHGPLPMGDYTIGRQRVGSSRRDLTPDPTNQMFGRSAFQIHGCTDPAKCSEGCIAAVSGATRDLLNRLLHLEEGRNRLHVTY